jgi:hypothetical protein
MSDSANSGIVGGIPAGWYPDPAGSENKRWWDGTQWTTHLQEPEPAPALPAFGNYVPADQRPVTALPIADAGTAYTRAGWWLAFSPVWIVIPQIIVVESITSLISATAATQYSAFAPGLGLLNLVLWVVLVALAYSDHKKLLAAGNETAAAPWWVLLTPIVYLILRAQHVRQYATGAWSLVIWWIVAVFVTPGLGVLAIFAAYGIFAN